MSGGEIDVLFSDFDRGRRRRDRCVAAEIVLSVEKFLGNRLIPGCALCCALEREAH